MQIGEFQDLIRERYEKRDRERGTAATFMWFVEEVGELATALGGQDAENKAEEFAKLAVKDGWEDTINKFNKLYKAPDTQKQGDPNAFRLQNLSSIQRISTAAVGVLVVQTVGDPAAEFLVNRGRKEAQFRNRLHSLVPQDANTLETPALIIEFKPDMSYYCLKHLSVNRLEQAEYEKIKAVRAYREDLFQSQSLAAVHFAPENILKRMNYRPAREEEEPSDANTPPQSGEAL